MAMAYVTLLLHAGVLSGRRGLFLHRLRFGFLRSCDLKLHGHCDNSHPGDNSQPSSIAHGILL